jgi:hypothetical protein
MWAEIRMEGFRKINSAHFIYSRFRDNLCVIVLRHGSQILVVITAALVILESVVTEAYGSSGEQYGRHKLT